MLNWYRQHLFALKSAASHLRASPGTFIFNVLVVAITLALPIAGLTVLENVSPVVRQLSIEPEISVFLHVDTPKANASALAFSLKRVLKENQLDARLKFIPKDQALAALEQTSSLAEVMSSLGSNPLPDAYVLSLSHADAGKLDRLVQQLQALDEVDTVQVDSAWIKRLAALLDILRYALLFLALSLCAVVIVVIFNATRLQVLSHQAEIGVARLLGATNSFIRKPYCYTGALLGFLAGCLALALIAASLIPMNRAIAEFARLYASEFRLAPPGIWLSVLLLAFCSALGLAGSFFSVRRQLARLGA